MGGSRLFGTTVLGFMDDILKAIQFIDDLVSGAPIPLIIHPISAIVSPLLMLMASQYLGYLKLQKWSCTVFILFVTLILSLLILYYLQPLSFDTSHRCTQFSKSLRPLICQQKKIAEVGRIILHREDNFQKLHKELITELNSTV